MITFEAFNRGDRGWSDPFHAFFRIKGKINVLETNFFVQQKDKYVSNVCALKFKLKNDIS